MAPGQHCLDVDHGRGIGIGGAGGAVWVVPEQGGPEPGPLGRGLQSERGPREPADVVPTLLGDPEQVARLVYPKGVEAKLGAGLAGTGRLGVARGPGHATSLVTRPAGRSD